MNRFDRILGILLFLRSKQTVSASDLARHFAVSTRTIYRDVDTLSALGVPVYAERGREGGFQLLEGYFLPPLMFTRGEAISLLLGLTLLRGLHAQPFPTEMAMAEKKLLAALPDRLRSLLAQAEKMIGFEQLPHDIFHTEPASQETVVTAAGEQAGSHESATISIFLQALLDQTFVLLQYQSPYRAKTHEYIVEPQGLFWDRDHWYLVGKRHDQKHPSSTWRADRVVRIKPHQATISSQTPFDVRELLGRQWLQSAMTVWRQNAPVKIHLPLSQAQRLQEDWYYRHACFEQITEDRVSMTFGESDRSLVMELLRWLGPGAELIEPQEWRATIREELSRMLASYRISPGDMVDTGDERTHYE
ncbi:MAG TPA: YafY family protein [Ktedonosporobacter sp.]|nr:YafY family protein [Ktedonosporobacter sp.]